MDGKRLIKSIRLRGLLSYGEKSEEITLEPLNVLIGRNASGKSNLIESIRLLHATPNDFAARIRQGGGISEWLWKGKQRFSEVEVPVAAVEAEIDYPDGIMPLRYTIRFTRVDQRMEIRDEVVLGSYEVNSFVWRYQASILLWPRQTAEQKVGTSEGRASQDLSAANFIQTQSILSQLKDPIHYPEITYLGEVFNNIRIYGEFNIGNDTSAAFPQKADLPDDFLLENASNLGLVLDDLSHRVAPMDRIIEKLKQAYGEVDRIQTRIRGTTVQVFVYERGLDQPIPATRLSDGTLRYLCLLTLLCHPEPPPLLCIEEPELGLHPDILPTIAELLIEASQRTQLIVTTHSDALVSALSDVPESVLVCERDDEGTHLHRLEPARLTEWLEKYSLGDLWRMGEIGGNRW
jgi:predicted ATPase